MFSWYKEELDEHMLTVDNATDYGVFHSAVDYPEWMGTRTHHQANIGASSGPVGPFPTPVLS